MAQFEVTVTYRVEVVDESAFRSAAEAAARSVQENAAWAFLVDDDGTREVDPADLPEPSPNVESSLALLLGRHEYPRIPGVRFGGMGIDAREIP
jgi:hypothetical protein